MLLNGIRTILSLLFPLITFPYVTKVLLPEGVGQANFASSITNYFILIGELGITSYAIREGAKRCEDKEEFGRFANQIWTISILSAFFAYICLLIALVISVKLNAYRWLIGIYSFQIIAKAIGMEWVLNIYEKYELVTLSNFLFQVLSLILLFLLVKEPTDVYCYVVIQMISAVGIGIVNHIYVRRKVRLKFVWEKEILRHFPPILLIFSITLATTIYVNLDTSMLGFIWGDAQVGYYTVAAKLYNIVKALINSVVTIYSVRLSSQYYQNKEEYLKTFKEVFQIIIGLTIPIAVGGYLLREEIIIILGGQEYLTATASMALLLTSLIFATLGNLFGAGVLLVVKKEKWMFAATLTGTLANMILNYVLIHQMKCTGAAVATLITEIIVCTILAFGASHYVKVSGTLAHVLKSVAVSVLFIPIVVVTERLVYNFRIRTIIEIIICVCVYMGGLLLVKDEMALSLAKQVRKLKN